MTSAGCARPAPAEPTAVDADSAASTACARGQPAAGSARKLTILFALAAAFCNALNLVTQHIASTSDPGHSKGWRFVRYLLSNPLWLFGWVALAGAFVFQALALHRVRCRWCSHSS